MLSQSPDISFAVIIVGSILSFFAVFIICMVIIFLKRAMKHRSHISQMELTQSQALLKSTISAQELERKRIGADIHDDIGPLLSLLKLQLNQVISSYTRKKEEPLLENCKQTIDSLIGSIRNVSRDLMPPVLYQLGLDEAIEQIRQKLKKLTDCEVSFDVRSSLNSIPQAQSIAVYRILQESLNNILKHAEATRIEVKIYHHNNVLNMSIKDDGKGFDHSKVSSGFGIKNIYARVESFGGKLDIVSRPGNGTSLHITMKVDDE